MEGKEENKNLKDPLVPSADGSPQPISDSPTSFPDPAPAVVTTVKTDQKEPTIVQPPPEYSKTPVSSVIISNKGKRNIPFFKIFMISSGIVVLLIWIGVGYLYLQNSNLRKSLSEKIANVTSAEPSPPPPTPAFDPSQIQIQNGNIIDTGFGESKVLVSKEDYPDSGIIGFSRVVVSPDNNLLCFESSPPATKPSLYTSKVDGSEAAFVSANKRNCLFDKESKNIFYMNQAGPQARVDIYAFNLETKTEKILTESLVTPGIQFSIIGMSADGTRVICQYTTPAIRETSVNCEVDTTSGEVETIDSPSEATEVETS